MPAVDVPRQTPKSSSTPFVEKMIHSFSTFLKALPGVVKLSVMTMIVNANLKSIARQPFPQVSRDFVRAFGNEVKGRTKSERHLHFRQSLDPADPSLRFNVVGENERELLSAGPARPPRRGSGGSFKNWPHMLAHLPLSKSHPSSKTQADGPRHHWFYIVIQPHKDDRREECQQSGDDRAEARENAW